MLNLVRQALTSTGLVAPASRLMFNVTVSKGDVISIDVGVAGGVWYHVQACRHYDLGSRFASDRLARQRFQERAPEPLAHFRHGDWSMLIASACEHRSVAAGDLSGRPGATMLARDLIGFFATARDHALVDNAGDTHDLFMSEARSFLAASVGLSPGVLAFLNALDPTDWADIPYVPQHGDFVLNNLGCSEGRLVVFDWEDYGATGLVGFDICLISLSVTGMSAASVRRIQEVVDPAGHPWAFAVEACRASGLDYPTFRRAIPIYLLVFRYLKRNYGQEIALRVDDILRQILV